MSEGPPRGTLSDVERAKSELQTFVHHVSHDFQEPLRALSGFSKILAQRAREKLSDKEREFLVHIVNGAEQAQAMLSGLLDYSRVEIRGGALEPTESTEIAQAAIRRLSKVIREAGAEVTCGSLPMIAADPVQMEQVFVQLLDNAIKFRREEPPRIQISADLLDELSVSGDGSTPTEGPRFWRFSVRDNGIGISPRDLSRVFEVFQRLHARGEYPGIGMGLTVSTRIIERHGGEMGVHSEPGVGSTFFFTVSDQGATEP